MVLDRVADAVDARDGRDDDRVAALEQRLGRREPHLLDVLVDARVLLDVEVARRDVGLGLVVVVVGDEVLDRVLGEELAQLGVELRGERLVRREDERRPAEARDHVRHRVGLARAGHAEQRLEGEPVAHAFGELVDRLGLVAGGRETCWCEPERAVGKRARLTHRLPELCDCGRTNPVTQLLYPMNARTRMLASRLASLASPRRDGAARPDPRRHRGLRRRPEPEQGESRRRRLLRRRRARCRCSSACAAPRASALESRRPAATCRSTASRPTTARCRSSCSAESKHQGRAGRHRADARRHRRAQGRRRLPARHQPEARRSGSAIRAGRTTARSSRHAGSRCNAYPYYDAATHGLNFDAMPRALEALPAGAIVVLHACCHNPTGVDLAPTSGAAVLES